MFHPRTSWSSLFHLTCQKKQSCTWYDYAGFIECSMCNLIIHIFGLLRANSFTQHARNELTSGHLTELLCVQSWVQSSAPNHSNLHWSNKKCGKLLRGTRYNQSSTNKVLWRALFIKQNLRFGLVWSAWVVWSSLIVLYFL